MALMQLKEFHQNPDLFEFKTIPTPPLNSVLEQYQLTHGINTMKDYVEELGTDKEKLNALVSRRPLDRDFVSYSA